MDQKLKDILSRLKSAPDSATLHPDEVSHIEKALFEDTMVPGLGNKASYLDHLRDNGNSGFHVNMDLADLGAINKQHGEGVGDQAIIAGGNIIRDAAQQHGGRAFRNGGDEFKGAFTSREKAQAFAQQVKEQMDTHPEKFGGTHRLAASIGVGHNPEAAERGLMQAKWSTGSKDPVSGKRINGYPMGQAPSVIGDMTHELPPANWQPAENRAQQLKQPQPAMSAAPPPSQMSIAGHPSISAAYNYNSPSTPTKSNTTTINYTNPLSKTETHEFGKNMMGIVGLTGPKFSHSHQGLDDLKQEAADKGFKYATALSHDQKSMGIIHGLDLKGLRDLGKKFGREHVLATDGKTHIYLHTNGPKADHFHVGTGYDTSSPQHVFHVGEKTHGLAFNWNEIHPMDQS